MAIPVWIEGSVPGTGWVNDVYGPGFAGDYIVVGGAVQPVDADGNPVASAATSSVAWTEASASAPAWTEASIAASTWTEATG